MKLRVALAVLVWSLLPAACGGSSSSGDSSDPGTCGKSGRTGQTECTSLTCAAGQYCSGSLKCVNGCLADDNCAENQHCVICGSDTSGVCRNCDQQTAEVCGSGTDDGGTSNLCMRDTTQDQIQCGGLPPKAYSCPPNQEPPQTGCVQGPAIGSGIWCCPS